MLLKKIEKKKQIIAEYENAREALKEKAPEEERFIFEKIENYLHEEKDVKQTFAELILIKMELDEPRD
jgi:hypothetical protein